MCRELQEQPMLGLWNNAFTHKTRQEYKIDKNYADYNNNKNTLNALSSQIYRNPNVYFLHIPA